MNVDPCAAGAAAYAGIVKSPDIFVEGGLRCVVTMRCGPNHLNGTLSALRCAACVVHAADTPDVILKLTDDAILKKGAGE